MRKLATKQNSEITEKQETEKPKSPLQKQDSVNLDNLPDYVKQTIMTLVNSINGHQGP